MPGTSPLRMVVVDDQLTFAEVLAARLAHEPDLRPVAAVGSAAELWTVLGHEAVDIVLIGLDGTDPSADSVVDVVHQLATGHPGVRAVVLAATSDPLRVAEAIEAGACAWIPKDARLDRLLEAVRGVGRGETWIPAGLLTGALRILTDLQRGGGAHRSLLGRLTPRERDVLQCLVDGLNRDETARRLRLSPNTVRTHMQHLLRKLGVHSSLTAAAVARQLGMERRSPLVPTAAVPTPPPGLLAGAGTPLGGAHRGA